MVVTDDMGECPTPCKNGGGNVWAGECSGGICPRTEMSYTRAVL